MAKNSKQTSSKLTSAISIILIILLIFGILALGIRCSGIADPFSIEYNGTTYTANDKNVIVLPEDGEARFTVKNFGSRYTVRVEANVDFEYEVNGQKYSFADEQFTRYFIKSNNVFDSYFIIDCEPFGYFPENVLSDIWGGNDMTLPEITENCYFKLIVTSSEGEVITSAMRQDTPIKDVRVSPDRVVF